MSRISRSKCRRAISAAACSASAADCTMPQRRVERALEEVAHALLVVHHQHRMRLPVVLGQIHRQRSGRRRLGGAAGSTATGFFLTPAAESAPSAISCSIASPPASLILIDAVPCPERLEHDQAGNHDGQGTTKI